MVNESLVSSRRTAMLFCVFWVRLVTGSDESLVLPIDKTVSVFTSGQLRRGPRVDSP